MLLKQHVYVVKNNAFYNRKLMKSNFKIGVLKNFAIFTGENLVGVFFNNACSIIKKRLQHRFFHVDVAKFFKNSFFYGTPPVAASLGRFFEQSSKQNKEAVPRTTSVCSIRTVLFEVWCYLISRKSILLIKIENWLGGVCLIQPLWYVLFI